jgi:hypothetical protein
MTPLFASAQDSNKGPLFLNDLVGDREFFEPWGIGIDIFTMEQDYAIESLSFQIPGIEEIDSSLVGVNTEVRHYDLKADVWLTPFLNVFGLIGWVDADTYVDLSNLPIDVFGNPLPSFPVSYDGTVYGLGLNLVYGGEHWFAALNNTWTDTDLSGDFNSSVTTFTVQPRVGLIRNKWTFWVGGMYLDTEEKHSGSVSIPIPGWPPVPFSVELGTMEKWNYAVGAGHIFSPKAHISLEVGFGDRDHTLFNFTYRF